MNCPKCKSSKTEIYWGVLVYCKACNCSSIKGEDRYILVCPKDGSVVFPRVNYEIPTMVCIQCGEEYSVPGESKPEIFEKVLE